MRHWEHGGALLKNKQIDLKLNISDKADKMAEIEKNERQVQQQQERDDEMREMALRLRRRYMKPIISIFPLDIYLYIFF